jgi:hypothetical protein
MRHHLPQVARGRNVALLPSGARIRQGSCQHVTSAQQRLSDVVLVEILFVVCGSHASMFVIRLRLEVVRREREEDQVDAAGVGEAGIAHDAFALQASLESGPLGGQVPGGGLEFHALEAVVNQ